MRAPRLTRHRRLARLLSFVAGALSLLLVPIESSAQGLSEDLLRGLGEDFKSELFQRLEQGLQQRFDSDVKLESPVDRTRREAENRRRARQAKQDLKKSGIEGKLDEERTLTPLERDYSLRIGRVVEQFGYDIFRPLGEPGELLVGAIQQDYILGIGDEFVVTFHGQKSRTVRVFVDREGRVILPALPPIPAAGRTYGEFVRDVRATTERSLLGTEVFVSLGSVRAISVMVIGEVEHPGMKQLTALSTVIDALITAGGIKRTGTLRRIRVVRGDTSFWIDAYNLLFTGTFDREIRIFDGDRIVVPPIGATIAVAGKVKRPAIFELAERHKRIPLDRALAFAGGPLRPVGNRFLHVSIDASGRELVVERDPRSGVRISDGDILFVDFRENILLGSVVLDGHVRLKQRRSVVSADSVAKLIGNGTLLEENPYLLFAAILTTDPRTRAARFVPVNLEQVLAGNEDHSLNSRDTLIVLGTDDVRYLASSDVQAILSGRPLERFEIAGAKDRRVGVRTLSLEEAFGAEFERRLRAGDGDGEFGLIRDERLSTGRSRTALRGEREPRTKRAMLQRETGAAERRIADDEFAELFEEPAPLCKGLRALASITASARAGRYASAVRAVSTGQDVVIENRLPCPDIFERYGDLLPFVLDYVVSLNGEVRVPGAYPILPGTPLESVVAVAGGLTREVDLTSVELTRFTVESLKGVALVKRGLVNLATTGASDVTLNPGDSVRFNPVFTDRDSGPVLLAGEFIRPGLYEIRRGERLSDLIARAGGITPQAYPFGAVFTRERVKEAEREANDRQASELENALVIAMTTRGAAGARAAGAASTIQNLAIQLREAPAVGRVVIEADPKMLAARPELDTVLEPGDRLFMPKLPNSVSVIGEVLNPGTLQFASGLEADDYIDMAGGFRRSADDARVFVVLPNGTARPVSLSAWNRTPVRVPQGSTIVVPRDPLPFDLFTFLKDTSEIISRLAITAASLAVISNR